MWRQKLALLVFQMKKDDSTLVGCQMLECRGREPCTPLKNWRRVEYGTKLVYESCLTPGDSGDRVVVLA